ncbi:MAG: hypothetical protein ACSHYB_07975 [Roseibacillus sp.]
MTTHTDCPAFSIAKRIGLTLLHSIWLMTFVVVSFGFVLMSSGQDLGGNRDSSEEISETKSEEELGEKISAVSPVRSYDRLTQIEREVKEFLKSDLIAEAEKRILEELPAMSQLWLSESYLSLDGAAADSLQKAIAQEPRLLPILVAAILDLEESEAIKAGMLDVVGAEKEASLLYGKILASDPKGSSVIRLHQIRLLGGAEPNKLISLLSGKTNPQKIRDAIGSAFRATKSFEQSIAFMNALSEYLETVAIAPEVRFDWVSGMSYAFGSDHYRRNRLFGGYQLPSVWEPQAPHDHQMRGKENNAEHVKVRHQAYRRYCRASLRLPDQAAWGFSHLVALADLEGKFDTHPVLVEQARTALKASGQPTRLGLFATAKKSPRFFSPELYLAYSRWKGKRVELSELSEPIVAQIERLESLLQVKPADFAALSQALIEDATLKEVPIYYPSGGVGVTEGLTGAVATRRLHEVLLIWNARQNDAEIESLILSCAQKGKEDASSSDVAKGLVNYLRVVESAKGPDQVRDLLEQLTTIYLGPPPERAKALETLAPLNVICRLGVREYPAERYLAVLKLMLKEPSLIFLALEKAAELDLLERMEIRDWIEDDDFRSKPEEVIARLGYSPLVENVEGFHAIFRSSGLSFASNFPKEQTLLEWVVAEIEKLDEVSQKPILSYLEEKKTFGAEVMVALLSEQSQSKVAEVLRKRADVISELSDEGKRRIATFVIPQLSQDAKDVRKFFEEVLVDENEVQLKVFKESLMPKDDDSRTRRENAPGEVFLRFYQQGPGLALLALREVQGVQEEGAGKVALFSGVSARVHESMASELLERINYGVYPPSEGRKETEFYLRVLADEQLGPHLILNPQLLTPRFSDAKTDEQRLDGMKNALAWIAEVYPENLAKEYFFIATIERGGWLSYSAQRAAKNAEYQQEVLSALPPSFRTLADAALELGSVSDGWIYQEPVKPKWSEPKVAEAFKVVAELLADEGLPLSLRIAVATSVCKSCRVQTAPKVARQCAGLLADAWEARIPVGDFQAEEILRVFSYQEMSEPDLQVADRLVKAWERRLTQKELEAGEVVRISHTEIWLAGLWAVLGDDASFTNAMNKRYLDLSGYQALQLLPLLVRAGKAEAAAGMVKSCALELARRTSSDQRTYYDQAIEKNLPALLVQLGAPEEQVLVEAHLKGLRNWPFATELSTREERMMGIAERACKMSFEHSDIRKGVYRLCFQERASAKYLAEGYIEMVELERLESTMEASSRSGWGRLAEEMIHCVLSAGEVEKAMEVLKVMEEKSRGGGKNYKTVWEAMSKGISSAVSTHQNHPELLEKMLPATRFMAASSAEWGLSDRDRVGDYARNIFCHAKLNRMGAWREWREGLESELGEELDALWFPKNGRMIWLVESRMRKDVPLAERLAVMKNILSEPQVVGTSGKLHDDAIGMLRKQGCFTAEELLEVEEELVEVMRLKK